MNITAFQVDMLFDAIKDSSSLTSEVSVYWDYSGRGMYGKPCIGFTTDQPLLVHGIICATLATEQAQAEDLGKDYTGIYWYDLKPQTDNMGLSAILYYPNLQLAE